MQRSNRKLGRMTDVLGGSERSLPERLRREGPTWNALGAGRCRALSGKSLSSRRERQGQGLGAVSGGVFAKHQEGQWGRRDRASAGRAEEARRDGTDHEVPVGHSKDSGFTLLSCLLLCPQSSQQTRHKHLLHEVMATLYYPECETGGEGREGKKLLAGDDERTGRGKSRKETSQEAADSRTSGSPGSPDQPQPTNI